MSKIKNYINKHLFFLKKNKKHYNFKKNKLLQILFINKSGKYKKSKTINGVCVSKRNTTSNIRIKLKTSVNGNIVIHVFYFYSPLIKKVVF